MGIFMQVILPLYIERPILLWDVTPKGSSVPVPTPENVIQTLADYACTSMMIVPSFLVAWAHDEKAVECLQQMNYIVSRLS